MTSNPGPIYNVKKFPCLKFSNLLFWHWATIPTRFTVPYSPLPGDHNRSPFRAYLDFAYHSECLTSPSLLQHPRPQLLVCCTFQDPALTMVTECPPAVVTLPRIAPTNLVMGRLAYMDTTGSHRWFTRKVRLLFRTTMPPRLHTPLLRINRGPLLPCEPPRFALSPSHDMAWFP